MVWSLSQKSYSLPKISSSSSSFFSQLVKNQSKTSQLFFSQIFMKICLKPRFRMESSKVVLVFQISLSSSSFLPWLVKNWSKLSKLFSLDFHENSQPTFRVESSKTVLIFQNFFVFFSFLPQWIENHSKMCQKFIFLDFHENWYIT